MYNTIMNSLKVKIEIDESVRECEVTIKCAQVDENVLKIQKLLSAESSVAEPIIFYKNDTEFFLPLKDILFFETDDGTIWAHTVTDEFEVRYKLYELEERLPSQFLRISKSTILNSHLVYSITKNLTGASKIEFQGTKKIVYCSRNYYKDLKNRLTP